MRRSPDTDLISVRLRNKTVLSVRTVKNEYGRKVKVRQLIKTPFHEWVLREHRENEVVVIKAFESQIEAAEHGFITYGVWCA